MKVNNEMKKVITACFNPLMASNYCLPEMSSLLPLNIGIEHSVPSTLSDYH
jgi:hypothetical protein